MFLFSFYDGRNLVLVQAFAIWRWHNFIESEGVGDKTVVHISMEESCCKLSRCRVDARAHIPAYDAEPCACVRVVAVSIVF